MVELETSLTRRQHDVAGASITISSRVAALFLLLLVAAAVASRSLDADHASGAALRLVGAVLALAIVPGALVTLLWSPRDQLTALEVVGFGIAMTFGLVQLLTIVAVLVHVNVAFVLVVLLGLSLATAAWVISRPSATVVISLDELLVTIPLVLLAGVLYLQGSPFDTYEDQVHIAIVRRLSQLEYPRLDNLYFAPHIVYTYPFPGTHYFVSLITRFSDMDPLFVYHKLRFFWGPAALVMLYLSARAVYGAGAVACGVTITAVALICSGAFAMVPEFPWGWGQLVPYSHASDVAMTVLLPAMLVMAFEYLQAGVRREKAFFLVGTALLVVMLTIVHIREVVQFAAYLGCFLLVTIAVQRFRRYVRPTVTLLALVVAIALSYTLWQTRTAVLVAEIVDEQRTQLKQVFTANSIHDLLLTPASTLLNHFISSFDQIFSGLNPFFLFAGPCVLVLFWRRPLVWLIGASTVVYLLVMSVPLLAASYVYLTYFEILFTPIRNIIFFVYLFAGALLYAMAVALGRLDRTRILTLVAGATVGAFALLWSLGVNRTHAGFVAPLIAAYALTFLYARDEPFAWKRSAWTAVVVVTGVLALVALMPNHRPAARSAVINVRWTAGLPEPRRVRLERQFSLTEAEHGPDYSDAVNVWTYRLSDLSKANVEALVTNRDVADTHHIDRPLFTVPPQPPRMDHPFLGVERVTWLQYPGLGFFIAAAAFVWALGLVAPVALGSIRGRSAIASLHIALQAPFYTYVVPFTLCLVAFAAWSARPTLSPLALSPMPPTGRVGTPMELLARLPCVATPRMPARFTEKLFPDNYVMLPARTTCPPDADVIEWVRANVPTEAVIASDLWNPYPPSLFVPQQMVAFPPLDPAFLYQTELFKDYYRLFDERMRRYRVQPFFNAVETAAERVAFVKALGVTHVLVDPETYDEVRPALDSLPAQFTLKYSGGKWAVYEVIRHVA